MMILMFIQFYNELENITQLIYIVPEIERWILVWDF